MVQKIDTIIRPDGTETPAPDPEGEDGYTLDQLQKIVGGYIQIIPSNDGRDVVLNEEGKLMGLEPNPRATAMVSLFPGDYLAGNVLFTTNMA